MSFLNKHKGLLFFLIGSLILFCLSFILRNSFLLPIAQYSFSDSSSIYSVLFFAGVSELLSPQILIFLSLILTSILLIRGQKKWAVFFAVTMCFGMASVLVLKELFSIPRPAISGIYEIGWSFPSGHATAVAIFFFSALFAIEETIHNYKVIFLWATISATVVFVVGFSRIYLGVHWTSDVIAGFSLGVFWVSLIGLIFEKIYELPTNHS